MTDDRNIQDFNRGAALALDRLYGAFPVPTALRMDDLDETADATTRRAYAETIRFLRDEGLIRVQAETIADIFVGAVLTAKGLSLLQAVPEALQEKKPWHAWLSELVKDGSRSALAAAIKALLQRVGGLP